VPLAESSSQRGLQLTGWGTGWGGYVLIEVDDSKAFDRYQLFCNRNYGHVVRFIFEPLFDSDAALDA
jgi:hypothetical protein